MPFSVTVVVGVVGDEGESDPHPDRSAATTMTAKTLRMGGSLVLAVSGVNSIVTRDRLQPEP